MDIVRLEQFGTWHIGDGVNTLCNINTAEANKIIKVSNFIWDGLNLKCEKCNAIHYDYELKSNDISAIKELTKETVQLDSHLDKLYKKKLRKKHKCNIDSLQYLKDKQLVETTENLFKLAIADIMKDPYRNDPSVYQ